jgi:hypothetical protein
MEKISHNEYTFNHWLDGYPEPDFPFWKYLNGFKLNPVYLEIWKAKVFAFDKALEFTLNSAKNDILKKISRFDETRRKKYIQSYIEKTEKEFEGYGVMELIDQIDQNKFDKIDGKTYLRIKKQYDGLQNGTYLACTAHINDFFKAVLNFELSEFLKGDLNFNSEKEVFTPESKKTEKGEPLGVRYFILKEFFEGSKKFNSLPEKQKEQILAYMLGTIQRTAKALKNGEPRYLNDDHKSRAKDLINKIKKGDIL